MVGKAVCFESLLQSESKLLLLDSLVITAVLQSYILKRHFEMFYAALGANCMILLAFGVGT